jgi:ADP-ribose pyrophosphatase
MGEERFLYRGRYLGLAERQGWEFATRTNASSVAVLVAVTEDNEIVLVEQFRLPVGKRVIELPAGLVGDQGHPDEPILEAAQRELIEETGFAANSLTLLLECPSSAGMSDELITFYLAEGLQKVGPGGGDSSEDIVVHIVPLRQAAEWMGHQREAGLMLDPKVYTALFWLNRRLMDQAPCP